MGVSTRANLKHLKRAAKVISFGLMDKSVRANGKMTSCTEKLRANLLMAIAMRVNLRQVKNMAKGHTRLRAG